MNGTKRMIEFVNYPQFSFEKVMIKRDVESKLYYKNSYAC